MIENALIDLGSSLNLSLRIHAKITCDVHDPSSPLFVRCEPVINQLARGVVNPGSVVAETPPSSRECIVDFD